MIKNMGGALVNFIGILNKTEPVLNIMMTNNSIDRIVVTTKSKYYIKFKKQFFNTFNEQFKEFVTSNPEYSGLGESINRESLELAIKTGCNYVVIIYKDGSIYKVNPKLWLNFSINNNLIRLQDKINNFTRDDMTGLKDQVNETTCSIPVKLLERFDYV